jgi:hypothetical protein
MSLRLRPFPADLAGVASGWATTAEEALLWCGHAAAPVPAAQISAWAGAWRPGWPAWPGPGTRGSCCGPSGQRRRAALLRGGGLRAGRGGADSRVERRPAGRLHLAHPGQRPEDG